MTLVQYAGMIYSTCTLDSMGPRPEVLRSYYDAGACSHLQTMQGTALPALGGEGVIHIFSSFLGLWTSVDIRAQTLAFSPGLTGGLIREVPRGEASEGCFGIFMYRAMINDAIQSIKCQKKGHWGRDKKKTNLFLVATVIPE